MPAWLISIGDWLVGDPQSKILGSLAAIAALIILIITLWQVFKPSKKPNTEITTGYEINASSGRGSQTIVATGESTVNIGITLAEHEDALRRQEKRHQEEISKIENAHKEELEKKFTGGHVVAGVSKGIFIPPKTQIEGLSIDWSLVRISEVTSDNIFIKLPPFKWGTNSFHIKNIRLFREVGSRIGIIRFGDTGFQAEVIYTKNDLTVVAFGFLDVSPQN